MAKPFQQAGVEYQQCRARYLKSRRLQSSQIKGLKRLKALTLTILEKNGLEFFSDFFFKGLSIFSPKKSFYEVKPVPNESPVTLLATHAKKLGVHYQKFQKINPNVKKCHFFTVMIWNIIAIYIVKLKSVLHSQFLINLDKIW